MVKKLQQSPSGHPYNTLTSALCFAVIDQIAPMKEIRVKNNSPDWFDAEIHEEIDTRDKLFAKFPLFPSVNGSLIINSASILAKIKQNLFYLGQNGT